jgi:hypothetical protein
MAAIVPNGQEDSTTFGGRDYRLLRGRKDLGVPLYLSDPLGRMVTPQDAKAWFRKAVEFSTTARRQTVRFVRPTLGGALLGLEIGTSQGTLPVGAGRFGGTPHIAPSGAVLALHASDYNGWPRRWVSGRAARMAPRKNLPEIGVSSESGGCYATPPELNGSSVVPPCWNLALR